MTDKELTEVSNQIDSFIVNNIMEKGMTINEFNGVMMARMMIMNSEVNNVEGFLKLLEIMKEDQYHKPIASALQ
jgi:phosphoribosylamine-glycine ligase